MRVTSKGHRRLIIIGGTSWLYDRARHMGIDVVLVQKPSLANVESIRAVDRTLIIDYEKDPLLLPILKAIHEETPFDTCLTLTESALMVAAQINQELGLAGVTPDVVELTRDKYKMREHLKRKGFSPIRAMLARNLDELRTASVEIGYPLIAKPRNGVGSQKIQFVKSEAELLAISDQGLFDEEFIVEEYLEGPEFSVEAFSFAGMHTVFAITEKQTIPQNFVECGHRIPAQISSESREAITRYVQEFLAVIGISDGPSHTEMKLTPNGPRVIETHTRLGGDYIPDLVQLSTGYDLRSITLGWFCGGMEPIVEPKPRTGGAAIRYFLPQPGKLEHVSGMESARCEQGVVRVEINRKSGDRISEIKSSNDRVGYVIATGETSEQASRLCERISEQIRFCISE